MKKKPRILVVALAAIAVCWIFFPSLNTKRTGSTSKTDKTERANTIKKNEHNIFQHDN